MITFLKKLWPFGEAKAAQYSSVVAINGGRFIEAKVTVTAFSTWLEKPTIAESTLAADLAECIGLRYAENGVSVAYQNRTVSFYASEDDYASIFAAWTALRGARRA